MILKDYREVQMKAKKIIAGVLSTCMLLTTPVLPGQMIQAKAAGTSAVAQNEDGNPLRLWYNKPATKGTKILDGGGFGTTEEDNQWQQYTLPIGNSYMGANVYGEITNERLTFNEKSLWNGGPSNSRLDYIGGNRFTANNGKPMSEVYEEIGELFLAGKDKEASDLCNQLTGLGGDKGYGSYQSWGDIYLNFDGITDNANLVPTDYVRDLDLTNAVANVDFSVDGTQYHREYFISYPDNVLVMKLTAEGDEKLNFNVSFPVDNAEGVVGKKLGKEVTYTATNDTLVTAGKMQDNQMLMNSLVKVVPTSGGTVAPAGNESLQITDASEVLIYVAADTDYKNEYPVYRTGVTADELAQSVAETVDKAVAKGFDKVKEDHVADYESIFDRLELDLGHTVSSKPTDELLAAYKNGTATEPEKRQLEVMLYQYGRFMTIESSRGDDLPANLQGVWQNRVGDAGRVPWGSDYHMNVNLQMNYWPTYSANMAECAVPLINYVDSLREPGRVTADAYYGIKSENGEENGFTAHTQNNPFGWTTPGWDFSWGWSPAAVPWIIQNCWEYYEYTGDVEFMRKNLYPMLREQAQLYNNEKLLVDSKMPITLEDGTQSTRLVSVPTYSPEHGPRTLGNAYEQSLIWQLFEDASIAADVLGVDQDLKAEWKAKQSRLAPIEVGDSGQIKEWYNETTLGSMGTKGHRHMSHLLGLFPGDLISVDSDKYMDAAIISLKDRGLEATGWGMGQRINAWARTGDAEVSYEEINALFNTGIYPNLFDSHAPFQIDGNFGYTSGVNEMLMQSNMGYINVLPALPEEWANGSINGIVARGNFELGMNWTDGKASEVRALSKNGGLCTVQYTGINEAKVVDSKGVEVSFNVESRDRINFDTVKGEIYTITEFADVPVGPANLSANYTGTKGTELAWDAVEAEGAVYTVYRKDDESYVKIKENITSNNYMDTAPFNTEASKLKYKITYTVGDKESKFSNVAATLDLAEKGMIDDTNPRVEYTGAWKPYENAAHYGKFIHIVEDAKEGESISLVFSGKGVKVIAPKNKDRGYMDVYIDGEKVGTADFYDPKDLKQQVVYEVTGLKDEKHEIKLVATGTHNPSSTKSKIEFDAFQVLGNKYSVMFGSDKVGNAGTLPSAIRDFEGTAMKLPECNMRVNGFSFAGWNDGTETYSAGTSYRIPKGDTTFKAVWTESAGFKIPSSELSAVADSQEKDTIGANDGPGGNAVDGNESTIWHSAYSAGKVMPNIPENKNNSITIDLGSSYTVNQFEYVPRASINGRILGYQLLYSVSESGEDFVAIPGGEGTWVNDTNKKSVSFAPVEARRIQLRVMASAGDEPDKFISAAEFYIYHNGAVKGVTVNESATIEAGKTQNLVANVQPSEASNTDVSWRSKDSTIASVDSNGLVTARKVGKTQIIVTTDEGDYEAICNVEVIGTKANEITLNQTELSLNEGGASALVATVLPEGSVNKNVKWSSGDNAVATVDQSGNVNAVSAGSTTIKVTTEDGTVKAYCDIKVIAPVTGIAITPSEAELYVGFDTTLLAQFTPANASNKNVTWTSSDPEVAAVDQTGTVTPLKNGTATITVTTEDGNKTAACEVNVTGKILVTGITVAPKTANVEVDGTTKLTTVISPADASIQNLEWISSDEAIAVVEGGVVTGITEGNVTITVTSLDNPEAMDTCEINVIPAAPEAIPVAGVVLVPNEQVVEIGKTYTLEEVIVPKDATNKNVNWKSSREDVASVSNGVVTAHKAGSAIITVTTVDGSLTASCTITVPKMKYNVILNADGGMVSPQNKIVEEGSAYGPLPTPTKAGYTFLGWYNGNTQVKATDICNSHMTLTAKWDKIVNKPGKVTGVKASKNKTNSIQISWNKAENADSYIVSRYDSSKKKWSDVKTTSSTSYTDKKTKAGTEYKYRVAASNKAGKGSYSSTITTATKPVKPSLKASRSGSKVKLTWKKYNTEKTEVYMKINKGSYEKIATTSGKATSYTKTKLEKGNTYTFRIRGVVKADSNQNGAYSATRTFKM